MLSRRNEYKVTEVFSVLFVTLLLVFSDLTAFFFKQSILVVILTLYCLLADTTPV